MQSQMRRLPIWIALLAAGLLLAPAADAYELVMFRRAGCPWCAAWDRDIGPIYAKSEVGRRTPLRHVDLDRDAGLKLRLKSPVRFTPTFVLVDGDREIGRIEGYPGEDFFWGLLERLTARPPAEPSSEPAR
jgi:thioredoxin-related protein